MPMTSQTTTNLDNLSPFFDSADIEAICEPPVEGYRKVIGSHGLRFDASGRLLDKHEDALQGQIRFVWGFYRTFLM